MLQVFNYHQSSVTFRDEDGTVMVNATEMARSFGKLPHEWGRLSSTQDFLTALTKAKSGKSRIADFQAIVTIRGGLNPGTWMHEDVALEFARWLSPEFAIWCNDRIKELLRHGMTATPATLEKMINDPDTIIALATALKSERAEKERLQLQNEAQAKELVEAAPKVGYFNEVLQSEALIVTNVIAKELGMSAIELNKLLHRKGVIYKSGDTWVLYAKYQQMGLTGTKTAAFTDSRGETQTRIHTYWSEKGRKFIHDLVKADWMPPTEKKNYSTTAR